MRLDTRSTGRLALTGGLACCLLAVGCGSAQPPGAVGSGSTASSSPSSPSSPATGPTSSSPATGPTSSSPAARRTPSAGHRIAKILVIMEENHSVGQVFPAHMPYLWSLARKYGRASAWSDVGHPSLPNYLAIFGGSS